jgi:hypothetical protein
MKPLGIIFIIIGLACSFFAYESMSESKSERLVRGQYERAKDWNDAAVKAKNFGEAAEKVSRSVSEIAGVSPIKTRDWDSSVYESAESVKNHADEYKNLSEKREEKIKYLFITGVCFTTLGLVLTVAAPKR